MYFSIYIGKTQTTPWGKIKKERDVYFSIYRKNTLLGKLLFLYIYKKNTNQSGAKRKEKEILYIVTIYIRKT